MLELTTGVQDRSCCIVAEAGRDHRQGKAVGREGHEWKGEGHD